MHETGGIVWVWLGGGETPPFPDLPFNDEHGLETVHTISVVPANWLQGLEGGIDSVHAPILHRSVIEAMLSEREGSSDTAGVRATFAAPPTYETEPTPFGMRQASLRRTEEDRTYVRVAHFFFPFVVAVPNGYGSAVHVFCFAPDRRHPSPRGVRQLRRDAALAARRQRRARPATFPTRATSRRCAAITRPGGARTAS